MHIYIISFSPCSGIVVSGYSKTLINDWLKSYFSKAIIPYKSFKKMYKIDETGEFKGKFAKTFDDFQNHFFLTSRI